MSGERKIDRNRKAACMVRYKAENRDKTNRLKHVRKAEKQEAKDKLKTLKVPRGTARAKRRANLPAQLPVE